MTLKQNIITIIISGSLFFTMIASCGSRVQKPDDAFELVKKERMMSSDSNFVSKEIIQASMKTEIVKKIETPDEWTIFKLEMEKKIRSNENSIQRIKSQPDLNPSSRRKLTSLEKDNNNLKMSINEYPEEVKAKWKAFKSSMSHNANEIDLELIALKTAQNK